MTQVKFNEAFDDEVPNFTLRKLKAQDDDAASSTSASSATFGRGIDAYTEGVASGSDEDTTALSLASNDAKALKQLCQYCLTTHCICAALPKIVGSLAQQGASIPPKLKKWQLSGAAVLQDLQQQQLVEDPWQLYDFILDDDDIPSGPPPGLPAPPGLPGHLRAEVQVPNGFLPPPGLHHPPNLQAMWNECPMSKAFTVQSFRREVTRILREIKVHKNIGLAVRQVRMMNVPKHRHADEFSDILTLAVEESRGPSRRVCIAFVVGLLNVFDREQCLNGLRIFYKEIYPNLCSEVANLKSITAAELMPTLKTVLKPQEIEALRSHVKM